jgi:hypothetical protein
MKATILTAILTMFLLTGINLSANAQTYYNVYLCDNGTATLRTPEEASLVAGDKVRWYKDGVELPGSPIAYTGANSTNYALPTNLAVGEHQYTSAIESAGGCLGDPSDPFSVYKLPTKNLALSAPTNATYCGDNSAAVVASQITATATPASNLPAGISYSYVWTVTKDGAPVSPLTSVGTDNGSETNNNVFTMTATGAGSYVFSATVVYKLSAGNTGVMRSGDTKGCEVGSTSSQTVTVTPKPGKPSIVIVN